MDWKNMNYPHRETTLIHQGDVLYAEERITNGETISISGKDAITIAKKAIIRRNALIGTLNRLRTIDNRVKVTNNTSPQIGQ